MQDLLSGIWMEYAKHFLPMPERLPPLSEGEKVNFEDILLSKLLSSPGTLNSSKSA
jgi:hypothetical protein